MVNMWWDGDKEEKPVGLGQRNPAISAVNRSTAIIVSAIFVVALLGKLFLHDDVVRIKKNYTDLHHRVNQLERICDEQK